MAQARQEAAKVERRRVATDMLKDGEPLAKIEKHSHLEEDVIRALAKKLNLPIA